MSGEFLQINTYLVRELKAGGLWTAAIREQIKRAEGSTAAYSTSTNGWLTKAGSVGADLRKSLAVGTAGFVPTPP